MKIKNLVLCVIFLITISCASIKVSKVYDAEKINSIKTWSLEFKYEPGEVSKTETTDLDEEITTTKFGNYPILLGFKDDIYYYLKDNYNIKIKKDDPKAEGKILLSPIRFCNYMVLSTDIFITASDNSEETLSRIKVNTVSGGQNILEPCTKAIAQNLNL